MSAIISDICCAGSDAALSVPTQLLSKALSVHSMNPSNLMACFIVKPGTDVGERHVPFKINCTGATHSVPGVLLLRIVFDASSSMFLYLPAEVQ